MKLALFDMDGVVVQTEHLKAAAHAAAVKHLGGCAPPDLYPSVMGQTHADVRAAFIRAGGAPIDPDEYTQVYRQLYYGWIETQAKLSPGTIALLTGLRESGYQLGLVTSSSVHSARKVFDLLGLDELFSVRIFAEDVQHGKPDPEPYRLAVTRLGGLDGANEQCHGVAFEDSQAGVASAAGARLAVIALRHPFNRGQDFSLARMVIESLEDTEGLLRQVEYLLDQNC